MKSKITFHKLASLLLISDTYSEFLIPKLWIDLVQTALVVSNEITNAFLFSDALITSHIHRNYLSMTMNKFKIAIPILINRNI
jgi:hypothetical protein